MGAQNAEMAALMADRAKQKFLSPANATYDRVYLTPEKFGAVGDGVADDYPAFQAMADAANTAGAAYVHVPAGDYYLSDGVGFDCEDLEIYLAAGSHIFTTAATTIMGGTLCAIGHIGLGTATSPRRGSVKIHGPGHVTGWVGGPNENAIGIVRYDKVIVDGPFVTAGHKGVTAQIGCPEVDIRNIVSDNCVHQVVTVEDQAQAVRARVTNVRFGTCGQHAVLVSSGRATVRDIRGDEAHIEGSSTAGAVHVTTTTTLDWAEVTDVRIADVNAAYGVVVSQAQDFLVDRVHIGAGTNTAVSLFNCANGGEVGTVTAPASPNGAVAGGTTPAAKLRRTGRSAESRRALTVGEATMDRLNINSTSISLPTGTMRVGYFEATKTETVTKVRILTGGSIPTGVTLMRVGVFSVADDETLTLIASTPSDTALLAATNTAYTKNLSASFVKRAGQRYAVGLLAVYSGGSLQVPGQSMAGGISTEAALSPRLAAAVSALADLPATQSIGAPQGTAAMPYLAVAP